MVIPDEMPLNTNYPGSGPEKPDGRRTATGSVFPYRMTNAYKARIIASFDTEGHSVHSCTGQCVGIVIEHCLKNNLDFQLIRTTPGGFYIERLPRRRKKI